MEDDLKEKILHEWAVLIPALEAFQTRFRSWLAIVDESWWGGSFENRVRTGVRYTQQRYVPMFRAVGYTSIRLQWWEMDLE